MGTRSWLWGWGPMLLCSLGKGKNLLSKWFDYPPTCVLSSI